MRMLGIILIVAGILLMVFRGFSYVREKKVVDIGPIEVNAKEREHVSWPLYVGALATVAGIVIVASARKRLA